MTNLDTIRTEQILRERERLIKKLNSIELRNKLIDAYSESEEGQIEALLEDVVAYLKKEDFANY